MKKPVVILGVVFMAVVLGVMIYLTVPESDFRVEVCMEFQGKTSCRKVSGKTETDTMRTAIGNACGEISSGVTDTISCQNTYPKSIVWLKRGQAPKQ